MTMTDVRDVSLDILVVESDYQGNFSRVDGRLRIRMPIILVA